MQTAKAHFDAGRLSDAIAELNQALRSRPADGGLRTFLFELLCLDGALERAAKQLDVLSTQSGEPGVELAIQVYRSLLSAEERRRSVFHGDGLPKFIAPPEPHVDAYLLLLRRLESASADEAARLLEEAEDSLPAVSGRRGAQPFASIRDADDRLAGVLEVFHEGEYLWVPFDQIVRLEVTPPRKLRELIWAQAKLEVRGQPVGDVFIPALYVDSHLHSDGHVKAGRLTEWEARHDTIVVGKGQRMLLVDDEEIALLDLGVVDFASAVAGAV